MVLRYLHMRTTAIDFAVSSGCLLSHLCQEASDCCCLYTQSAFHLQTKTGQGKSGAQPAFFFAPSTLKIADYFQADGHVRRSLY